MKQAAKRSPFGPREMSRWMSSPDPVAVLSAARGVSGKDDKRRMQMLRRDLQELEVHPRDVKSLRGQWWSDAEQRMRPEPSIAVRGLDFNDALELAKRYGQDAFIHKSGEGVVGMYEGYRDEDEGGLRVVVPSREGSPVFGADALVSQPRKPKTERRGPPAEPPEELFSGSRSNTFEITYDWEDPRREVALEQPMPATREQVENNFTSAPAVAPNDGRGGLEETSHPRSVPETRAAEARVELMTSRRAQFEPPLEEDPLAYDDVPAGAELPADEATMTAPELGDESPPLPPGVEPPASQESMPELESGGAENIRRVMNLATPQEIDYWANWYDVANDEARDLSQHLNYPLDVVAGVIAATSPNLKWEINVAAAEQILMRPEFYAQQVENRQREAGPLKAERAKRAAPIKAQLADTIAELEEAELEALALVQDDTRATKRTKATFKKARSKARAVAREQTKSSATDLNEAIAEVNAKYPFEGVPVYAANIQKALRIIETGDPAAGIAGPKVSVFYESMVDPQGTRRDIVLDGHAINIWRGDVTAALSDMKSLTKGQRQQIIDDYNQVASEWGLQPQEVQAITWTLWRQFKAGLDQSRTAQVMSEPSVDDADFLAQLNGVSAEEVLGLMPKAAAAPAVMAAARWLIAHPGVALALLKALPMLADITQRFRAGEATLEDAAEVASLAFDQVTERMSREGARMPYIDDRQVQGEVELSEVRAGDHVKFLGAFDKPGWPRVDAGETGRVRAVNTDAQTLSVDVQGAMLRGADVEVKRHTVDVPLHDVALVLSSADPRTS